MSEHFVKGGRHIEVPHLSETNASSLDEFRSARNATYAELSIAKLTAGKQNQASSTLEITPLSREITAFRAVGIDSQAQLTEDRLSVGRRALLAVIDSVCDKETGKSLREGLRQFELRATKDCLSKQEVVETYRQMTHILAAPGIDTERHEDRVQLALSTIRHCADPTTIRPKAEQNAEQAALEASVYSLRPSEAVRRIADAVGADDTAITHGIIGSRLEGNRVTAGAGNDVLMTGMERDLSHDDRIGGSVGTPFTVSGFRSVGIPLTVSDENEARQRRAVHAEPQHACFDGLENSVGMLVTVSGAKEMGDMIQNIRNTEHAAGDALPAFTRSALAAISGLIPFDGVVAAPERQNFLNCVQALVKSAPPDQLLGLTKAIASLNVCTRRELADLMAAAVQSWNQGRAKMVQEQHKKIDSQYAHAKKAVAESILSMRLS